MKKSQKKLSIEKFNVSKLNNLSKIFGGTGGEDGEHRTRTISSRVCEDDANGVI